MRLEHVEVAISTIGDRAIDALRLAGQLAYLFDVIVIHQIPDGNDHDAEKQLVALDVELDHIRYVACRELGVAKSRNLALRITRRKYLWFLDDDVEVDLAECEKFFAGEFCPDSDVITIAVRKKLEKPGYLFRCKARRHNRISILSVGTIEIIIKPDKAREADCWFPEDMGAGTDLPISDEPVFLSRCIRSGLIVSFQPVYLVLHPRESSGSDVLEPSHCRARGLAFARIFGPITGLILLIPFYLKYTPYCVERYGVRLFIEGFWNSIKGIFVAEKGRLI
jgi:glycosyltransferase involved in cell wall biosynthesis